MRSRPVLLLLLLATLTPSCGGGRPAPAREWVLDVAAMKKEEAARIDPQVLAALAGQGGDNPLLRIYRHMTGSLTLEPDGTWREVFSAPPLAQSRVTTGRWRWQGDQLVLTPAGERSPARALEPDGERLRSADGGPPGARTVIYRRR